MGTVGDGTGRPGRIRADGEEEESGSSRRSPWSPGARAHAGFSRPQVYAHAGAALDGKMYVTCGRRGEDYLKETHCYEPGSDTWHTLADGPVRRAWHGMATLLDKLYVIGGSNNDAGYRRDVHQVSGAASLGCQWGAGHGGRPGVGETRDTFPFTRLHFLERLQLHRQAEQRVERFPVAPRAPRLPALGTPPRGGVVTADNSAGLGVHTGLRQMARVHHRVPQRRASPGFTVTKSFNYKVSVTTLHDSGKMEKGDKTS